MRRWNSHLLAVCGIALLAMSSPTGILTIVSLPLRLDLRSDADDVVAERYRDAQRDALGHIHVLDARRGVIVTLDRNGRVLFTTGVRGSDRGQAGVPRRLRTVRGGNLLLVDEATAKLIEFAPSRTALRFVREVQIPFPIADACTIGGRTFMLGLHAGHAVHEVDGAGFILRSFGDPRGPARGFARQRLTTGMLQCGEADSSIVVAFSREPIVEAYSTRGALRWRIRIAGARGSDIDASKANSITYSVPADGADVLSYLGAFDSKHVVVQMRRLHRGEVPSPEHPETSTIALDLHDGKESLRGEALPVIVGGAATDVFVLDTAEPFGLHAARLVGKQRRD